MAGNGVRGVGRGPVYEHCVRSYLFGQSGGVKITAKGDKGGGTRIGIRKTIVRGGRSKLVKGKERIGGDAIQQTVGREQKCEAGVRGGHLTKKRQQGK